MPPPGFSATEFNPVFMREAIRLGRASLDGNLGGPFGCVIVSGGCIVGRGSNRVTSDNDPTAHAEIVAIRDACRTLNAFRLAGCAVYASCEPCPMCLGAVYWARPDSLFYASRRTDAAAAGFDDERIFRELTMEESRRSLFTAYCPDPEAIRLFDAWRSDAGRQPY